MYVYIYIYISCYIMSHHIMLYHIIWRGASEDWVPGPPEGTRQGETEGVPRSFERVGQNEIVADKLLRVCECTEQLGETARQTRR